jgi:FtsP/CotA-like multicopper oxidase with cupredoxin domain
MKDLVLSRRQLLKGAGAIGVLGAAGIPATALARDGGVDLLRWDLVEFPQGLAVAGGTCQTTDEATGDVTTLTGSGHAEPKKRTATGGGTFVHRHANGTEVVHGVYKVTGFQSWKPAGGNLAPAGAQDGIGTLEQTMGGLLVLHIAAMPASGGSVEAVLGIDCDLPGVRFPIEEGVHIDVLNFHFKQSGGFTLFHVLRGGHGD